MIIVHREPYLQDEAQVLERLTEFQTLYAEQTAIVSGRRWQYRRTGDGPRPLVMLPGVQGGGDVFFEIALALRGALDIITVSAPPILDGASMADAQSDFLAALGIARAALLGSSLGGYLAQVFCIRHPERAGQIFLANTFADPGPFLATMPPMASFSAIPATDLVGRNLEPMLRGAGDAGVRALQMVLRALVGPVQSAESYKARLLLLLGTTAIERLPKSDGDVIVIDSDDDPAILPEMRALMRRRYAGAEQHMIDGSGHLPAIQRPDAVSAVLRARLLEGRRSR